MDQYNAKIRIVKNGNSTIRISTHTPHERTALLSHALSIYYQHNTDLGPEDNGEYLDELVCSGLFSARSLAKICRSREVYLRAYAERKRSEGALPTRHGGRFEPESLEALTRSSKSEALTGYHDPRAVKAAVDAGSSVGTVATLLGIYPHGVKKLIAKAAQDGDGDGAYTAGQRGARTGGQERDPARDEQGTAAHRVHEGRGHDPVLADVGAQDGPGTAAWFERPDAAGDASGDGADRTVAAGAGDAPGLGEPVGPAHAHGVVPVPEADDFDPDDPEIRELLKEADDPVGQPAPQLDGEPGHRDAGGHQEAAPQPETDTVPGSEWATARWLRSFEIRV